MNSGFESRSWSEELLRLSARKTAEEEREFLAMVTDLRGRCTPEVASVLMKTFSAEPDYETQECVLSTLLSAPRGVYVHAMLEELPRLVHEAPEWADALVAIEVNNFPELIVQSFGGLQAGAQRSLVNVLSRSDFQVSNPAAVETLARLESK